MKSPQTKNSDERITPTDESMRGKIPPIEKSGQNPRIRASKIRQSFFIVRYPLLLILLFKHMWIFWRIVFSTWTPTNRRTIQYKWILILRMLCLTKNIVHNQGIGYHFKKGSYFWYRYPKSQKGYLWLPDTPEISN